VELYVAAVMTLSVIVTRCRRVTTSVSVIVTTVTHRRTVTRLVTAAAYTVVQRAGLQTPLVSSCFHLLPLCLLQKS